MKLTRGYWIGGLAALAGVVIGSFALASGGKKTTSPTPKPTPSPKPGGGGVQPGPGPGPQGPIATSFLDGHRYQFVYNIDDQATQTLVNDGVLATYLNGFYVTGGGFIVTSFTLDERDGVSAEADYVGSTVAVPKAPFTVYDEGAQASGKPGGTINPGLPPPSPAIPQVVQMGPPQSANVFPGDTLLVQWGTTNADLTTPPDPGVLQIQAAASQGGNMVATAVGAPGSSTKFTITVSSQWRQGVPTTYTPYDFFVHVCDPVNEPWCKRP